MKLAVALAALTLLICSPHTAFSEELPDLHGELLKKYQAANSVKSYNKQAALQRFRELYEAAPTSFTAADTYARLLIQLKQYEDAIPVLREAISLRHKKNIQSETVYNSMGFVLLQLERFDEALFYFQLEKQLLGFEDLPDSQRMKVFNNAGIALLSLDRYSEAKTEFEAASKLGSSRAKKNLQIVGSRLRAVQSGDEDRPGAFATVIAATAYRSRVPQIRRKISSLMSRPETEFSVFLNANKRYLISLGSNLSYPKAIRYLEEARHISNKEQMFVSNMFVGSSTYWKDVTSEFPVGSVDQS